MFKHIKRHVKLTCSISFFDAVGWLFIATSFDMYLNDFEDEFQLAHSSSVDFLLLYADDLVVFVNIVQELLN